MYLLVGTAGTQCLATSAPFPLKTITDLEEHYAISDQLTSFRFLEGQEKEHRISTYPTGREIAIGPSNSPGPTTFKLDPKSTLHSLRNETVQKGRRKS